MTDEKKPLDPSTITSLINDGAAPGTEPTSKVGEPLDPPAGQPQLQVIDGDGQPTSEIQEKQKKVDRLVETMTPREKQWAGHYQAQVLGIGERLIKRELPLMIARKEVSRRDASDPATLMLLGATLADGFMVAVNDEIIKRFGEDTTIADLVCICAHVVGRNMGINKSHGLDMADYQKRELLELFSAGVKMSEAYTAVMLEQPQSLIHKP